MQEWQVRSMNQLQAVVSQPALKRTHSGAHPAAAPQISLSIHKRGSMQIPCNLGQQRDANRGAPWQ
jgi:hypothetical protein